MAFGGEMRRVPLKRKNYQTFYGLALHTHASVERRWCLFGDPCLTVYLKSFNLFLCSKNNIGYMAT